MDWFDKLLDPCLSFFKVLYKLAPDMRLREGYKKFGIFHISEKLNIAVKWTALFIIGWIENNAIPH